MNENKPKSKTELTFNEYWNLQKEKGWKFLREFKKELLERLELNKEATLRSKKRKKSFSMPEKKEIVNIISEREGVEILLKSLFPEHELVGENEI
ncbi:MAG: hypothetical protein L3J35_03610 [Bacteroidales bacterium]|nr:hypothetical protein [Bacteroidales bacterium]